MSSTDDRQYHIFLSYRWGDKEAATEAVFNSFVNKVKAETGLHVFYDKNELRSGDFVENLRKSAGGAYVFMPVVTDSYISFGPESNRDLDKDFCLFEYLTALENGARVVPVFLDFKTNSTTQKLDYPEEEAGRLLEIVSGADLEDHFDEALSKKAEEVAKEDLEKVKLYLRRSQGVKLKTLDIDDEALSSFADVIFDRLFEKSEVGYYADVLDAQKKKRNAIFIPGEGFDDSGLTIEGTYVPVTLERLHTDEEIKTAREKHEELPKELFEDENLREQLMRDKYAVLVGDAGQGKSLAVKKLCIDLGERTKKLGFSKNEFFPMYYECKDFIQSLANDEDFYRALFKGIDLSQPGFEAVLRNCRPLFIFDAMDEVPASTMDILVDKINGVLISNHKTAGVHILFTSRPGQKRLASVNDMMIDQTPMTLVRRYKVQYFDSEKRDKYILKLANVRHESDEKKDTFFEKINEKEQTVKDYKDISRNPFFLFTIFTAYDPLVEDSLPETRFDAVEYAINSVIKREMYRISTVWKFIDKDDIKSIMGCLSYKIYKAKDSNDNLKINKDLLDECAKEFVDKKLEGLPEELNEFKKAMKLGQEYEINQFLNGSRLYTEAGFSHEFFAETYAAYFLWVEITNNASTEKYYGESNSAALDLWLKIKARSSTIQDFDEADTDAEYWKSVKKTLLLLSDKYSKESYIAESLVEGFQSVAEPDYDLICDAVSQFEKPHIKNRAADLILEKMMDRGCRGILTGHVDEECEFNEKEIWNSKVVVIWKCSDGINPYTELFYYPEIYTCFQSCFDDILDCINNNEANYNYLRRELKQELKAVFSGKMHEQLTDLYAKRKKDDSCKESATKMEAAASSARRGFAKIKESATVIKKETFKGCTLLTRIEIPDTVAKIENAAFNGCSELREVMIPAGVTSIGSAAFWDCAGLERITVDVNNPKYHTENNCIIENETNELILGCKNSIIPTDGSVTRIGEGAFFGCTGLRNVEIPACVTTIGDFAFFGCSRLARIEMKDGLVRILEGVFEGCTSLQSIEIPATVVQIGDYALNGCTNLETIDVNKKNAHYHSKNNCIIDKVTKELVAGCKTSIIPSDGSVTAIGDFAFKDCIGLTKIDIPSSVTEFGYRAFLGCTGLEVLTVDSNNTRYHSINNCIIDTETKELILGCRTSVIPLDDDVMEIGIGAFYGCAGLTNIIVPASVTTIECYAFYGCAGLKNITIPASVTTIEDHAFIGCTGLQSVFYQGSLEQWQSIDIDLRNAPLDRAKIVFNYSSV